MDAYRAKPLNFPWPPIIYRLAIVCALVLGHFVALPLPAMSGSFAWICGIALAITAISLNLWAVKTLIDGETTI